MQLTTYGRSSGFQVDPIEKKPLNHFLPGSRVLSFGTAGCNLGCQFCQNWSISKSRETDRLTEEAAPEEIASAAIDRGCPSVAFTYNDPVIFAEYAVDTAAACRRAGVRSVAVTAGYVTAEARPWLFSAFDAANVDLKAFAPEFYRSTCLAGKGGLADVKETLVWLKHESDVWFEITTLLIPGLNDSDAEIARESDWIRDRLGTDVPVHFTAYHPDFKLIDRPPTPPATVRRARDIARGRGLSFVYTGNIHDPEGQTTYCPECREAVVTRDRYTILDLHLDDHGACARCRTPIPGRWFA